MSTKNFIKHPALDRLALQNKRIAELQARWEAMPRLPFSESSYRDILQEMHLLLVIAALKKSRDATEQQLKNIGVKLQARPLIAHRVKN